MGKILRMITAAVSVFVLTAAGCSASEVSLNTEQEGKIILNAKNSGENSNAVTFTVKEGQDAVSVQYEITKGSVDISLYQTDAGDIETVPSIPDTEDAYYQAKDLKGTGSFVIDAEPGDYFVKFDQHKMNGIVTAEAVKKS